MRTLRDERGSALLTSIIVVATMLVLGTATLSIVLTQTDQTRKDRSGEEAFNLAEAALNAKAFLLARQWPPQTGAPVTPATACRTTQPSPGNLTTPAAAVTPTDQVQRILAQAYVGDPEAANSKWWTVACAEGGRDSWNSSLLDGAAWDNSTLADDAPRRMWVRAEAEVKGRKRAVVGLVQADKEPVFPPYAVVTGRMGGDLGSSLTNITTGTALGSLLQSLINVGSTDPMFKGTVGLRCSLLTDLTSCISGVYKLTSSLPAGLGNLLAGNKYVHFANDKTISTDKVAQLRQQAQSSGTYYTSVAANSSCLPAGNAGSAGKVTFIEQVGPLGKDSCVLTTASTPNAKALIVGSGGIIVNGPGLFTGVIYALRGKTLTGDVADVRIRNRGQVKGGVYVDDNPTLGSPAGALRRGTVQVIVPVDVCSGLSFTNSLLCSLGSLLDSVLGGLLNLSSILGQVAPYLPAVEYDGPTVKAVTTINDSAIVSGTFRQVQPMY